MAPKKQATAASAIKNTTLLIDNGAYTMKAGFVSSEPGLHDCHLIPNCIARDRERKVWIGSQLENAKDFGEMAFRRPVEKGYLVNWEGEKAVWNQAFFSQNAPLKVLQLLELSNSACWADTAIVRSERDELDLNGSA